MACGSVESTLQTSLLDIDCALVTEVATSGSDPEPDIQLPMTTRTNYSLNEDLVRQVIENIKDDKILAMANFDVQEKLCNISVSQLVQRMEQINGCLSNRKFTTAAKEEAWKGFYKKQEAVVESVNILVQHRQLASFLVLKTMQELIERKYCPASSGTEGTSEEPKISADEEDILLYVAGFVLYRARKNFSGKPSCLCIVEQAIKGTDEAFQGKLITIRSRGGLCEPKKELFTFFLGLEKIFRKLFALKDFCLNLFVKEVCNNDLVSNFYSCTWHSDVAEDDSYEIVLLFIFRLFFTTRCHAKCKHFFEKYCLKTKCHKKKKSLRNEID